jgi:4-hydroxy-tetrahydrodipicolinate reductase
MNILLLGYGKMGQMIDKMASEKGHHIVGRINVDNREDLKGLDNSSVDVAIDFSQPTAAVDNIKWCIDQQIPVAVGTTGWLDRQPEVDAYCEAKKGTYLYASNFSIGVNIFFKVNAYLARLMGSRHAYDISLKEIHHTQKLDAPSGTAITLAEGIIRNIDRKTGWVNGQTGKQNELPIKSERIDPTPGTHEVTYSSPIDTIDIKHTAHGREGFASGAILVAEWIVTQKGILTMDDFLAL